MIAGCNRLRGLARPLAVVLFGVCLAVLGAQSKKPDLSGEWRMQLTEVRSLSEDGRVQTVEGFMDPSRKQAMFKRVMVKQ